MAGISTVETAATTLGLAPINLIVWAKTNVGMGSLYRSQHELAPIYKKGNSGHLNNVELGRKGRWRSNVWSYPGTSSMGSDARQGLRYHPTVKPTNMLMDALLDVTARGDVVIDPFLGSARRSSPPTEPDGDAAGSRSILCMLTSSFAGFEAESGRAAVFQPSGETFASLAAQRGVEEPATNEVDSGR